MAALLTDILAARKNYSTFASFEMFENSFDWAAHVGSIL
jgi:hypothetical protein